jgi:hypothetical protein
LYQQLSKQLFISKMAAFETDTLDANNCLTRILPKRPKKPKNWIKYKNINK